LADTLKKKYQAKVELIPSHGGVFEVRREGELIFSKKATGRFPQHEEIFSKLDG